MDWRDLLCIFYVTKLCKQGTSFQKNVQRACSKMQKKRKKKKERKKGSEDWAPFSEEQKP